MCASCCAKRLHRGRAPHAEPLRALILALPWSGCERDGKGRAGQFGRHRQATLFDGEGLRQGTPLPSASVLQYGTNSELMAARGQVGEQSGRVGDKTHHLDGAIALNPQPPRAPAVTERTGFNGVGGTGLELGRGKLHRAPGGAKQDGHRVLAAGDMNILRGYGEKGDPYWAARYKTVFDRLEVMGLPCIGPEDPNGRQAEPWPSELPRDSRDVPTFHTNRRSPKTATRQLDYVFASTELTGLLNVRALNAPAE